MVQQRIKYTKDIDLNSSEPDVYWRADNAVAMHPVFGSLLTMGAITAVAAIADQVIKGIDNPYQFYPRMLDALEKSLFRMFGTDALREMASAITVAAFPSL